MFETLWKHDGWGIGIVDAPPSSLLTSGSTRAVRWLPLRRPQTFAADPFLVQHRGVTACFFEELPYATNRGHIAYALLGDDGAVSRPLPAIVEPYHLSYPFMLEHDGELLCIPEAASSGRIDAYVARRFPGDWVRKATLLAFPGVDPTIFEHEGRWWLLCTDGRHAWNSDLHAFHAPHPLGPWTPHAGNPVRRALAGGRPGGRPFVVDGRLYRPVQDCSRIYGGRLLIVEVLALSPDRFCERVVAIHEPDPLGPFPDGCHTASWAGGKVAIDGNHLHFEPLLAARAVKSKLQRLASV